MKYERKIFRIWKEPMRWFERPFTFRTRVHPTRNEIVLVGQGGNFSIEEVEQMLEILKEENKGYK